ncbi:dolichol kinase EVAN isoform X1 [Beta vulgaris subsp. vulgaris]|uniref:dolichol kinase EVAN isoform X1 n=1 Tax=Beta vulgaris subsp. vulgaris TaxID=3555 RepID=UPI0020370533|nr:dolichol kinase EVAN isoform X1 [Beta vulgaris subsp. vulgaris]
MALMSLSMLNGERAVVLLVLIRILSSTSFSLLFIESLALCLLAFAAFFVEISVENSINSTTKFTARPGASSGILLGAVTLPALVFSKLIQLSRGFLLAEVALEEFQYQKFLYWTTYISCFSVLLFLRLVIQHPSSSRFVVKCGFTFVMLGALVYLILPLDSSNDGMSGLLVALVFLWMFGHGIAAVKLIQHILCTFPSCASIGEALLMTCGLTTYFGDMLRSTLVKIVQCLTSLEVHMRYSIKRSEISTIIQGYLLGLLLFPLLFKFIVQIVGRFSSSSSYNAKIWNESGRSVVFFTLLAVSSAAIIPLWLQFVQDFQEHPLWWVLKFVFSEPYKRLSLCIYWVGVICVSVHRFYNISKSSKVERILLRKYYHLMAVSMFVPALILQPNFLNLAFGAALAAFLVLEIIRVWRIWPLGEMIHHFMNAFTDHRDSDLLIVSHFSLLLGCALPIWISSGFNDRPLAPFAGILSLGIGDTMASMVGYKYGVLRWSKTGKKTIEGTAAGITSVMAACSFLLPLLASTGYIQNWTSLLLAVIASGLLEAYTAQLDNAFIPLVFYSLLCL